MTRADLAARAGEIAAAVGLADGELVGVGWATVELDRAAAELTGLGPWVDGEREPLLGARVRASTAGGTAAPAVLLLEPDTEGRLAASLARAGEAVAAAWIRLGGDPARDPSADPVVGWSAVAEGPFGPERLRLGPAVGPHLLVVLPDR